MSSPPQGPSPRPISIRFVAGAGLFLVAFLIAVASASTDGQLGTLAGLTDEYLVLGAKLRVNGTLGLSRDEPSALRPPGYPAFLGFVLQAFVPDPRHLSAGEFGRRGGLAISSAQALLLAASALALFLWLSDRLTVGSSLAVAALYALNPWSLALVGLCHYAVLHWLTLILACWATTRALRSPRPWLGLAAAGVAWGLSNLVRPVTLLLPAVLLAVWMWQHRSLGAACRRAGPLALGMAVALAPWLARNHAVTGRLVSIADTQWQALWGQTVRSLPADANRYTWFELYHDYLPVFERVTGSPGYDYLLQNRRNAELESAFRSEAVRNLRERPSVYAGNVLSSLWSFALDWSTVLVRVRVHLLRCTKGGAAEKEWFRQGSALDFHPPGLDRAWAAVCWLVTLGGGAGALLGLRRRDDGVLVAVSVLACIALTQAAVFLSMMHHYQKWPLLLVLSGYGLDAAAARGRVPVRALQVAAVSVGLLLSAWLFWGPVGVDQAAR